MWPQLLHELLSEDAEQHIQCSCFYMFPNNHVPFCLLSPFQTCASLTPLCSPATEDADFVCLPSSAWHVLNSGIIWAFLLPALKGNKADDSGVIGCKITTTSLKRLRLYRAAELDNNYIWVHHFEKLSWCTFQLFCGILPLFDNDNDNVERRDQTIEGRGRYSNMIRLLCG